MRQAVQSKSLGVLLEIAASTGATSHQVLAVQGRPLPRTKREQQTSLYLESRCIIYSQSFEKKKDLVIVAAYVCQSLTNPYELRLLSAHGSQVTPLEASSQDNFRDPSTALFDLFLLLCFVSIHRRPYASESPELVCAGMATRPKFSL